MKVAVYYANDDVRIEERPKPTAGPGELVFRVHASGVCGSDVMEWYRKPKAPVVLGHEVAGEVVEVGPDVAGFAPGDRIVATHHVPCGECRYCRAGNEPVCDLLRTTHFDPGGFAEFVRLPAVNVERGTFAIPDDMSYEEGSFVEPLACVVRGQRIAGGAQGRTVAVLGSGMAGLLHVLWAKASGAERVLATDVHPFRLEAARRAGADVVIDASKQDVPSAVAAANDGRGADMVVVSTPAPQAIAQAVPCVDRGGHILFFAATEPGVTVPFPLADLWRDGISVVTSYAGPPDDLRAALDAIARRRVDVGPIVTHRLPLDRAQEAFRLVIDAGESIKVIIQPAE
ncbi:MAG TPA: zinc-dependent dehydrogenase [Actinomycetota bacterium]